MNWIKRWLLRPITISVFVFGLVLLFLNTSFYKALSPELDTQAEIWMELHQYNLAEKTLRLQLQSRPHDLETNFQYLQAVFALAPYEQPLAALEARYATLLMSKETRAIGHWGKAWIFLRQGNPKAAIHRFAVIQNDGLEYTYLGVGLAHQMLGDWAVAEQAFLTELKFDSESAYALRYLFAEYVKEEKWEAAQLLLKNYPTARSVVDRDDLRRLAFAAHDWTCYLDELLFQPLRSMHIFAIAASLFIALIWFFYFWRIDVFEQEPLLLSLFVMLLGALMAVLTVPLSDFLQLYLPIHSEGGIVLGLLQKIVHIGLLEEFLKFLPVLFVLRFTRQINEPVDALIYASLSALGFATLENIVVISQVGERILIARLLIATLMHMASTSILAYVWAMVRFTALGQNRRHYAAALLAGWLLAGVVHGLFDYLLLAGPPALTLAPLLMLVITVWLYGMLLRNSLNFSPFFNTPTLTNTRLVNYEWILSAGWWVLLLGYAFFYAYYATDAANAWLISNIWTTLPVVLGIFAALGELSLKKGEFVFP